ncbi:hypothetical protein CAOG_07687 [Capsaspora owczarzaki ATCC 30864]|uniref:Uncharacterized protein n=1 Tax=Capsaspora owczarzaki (strain ATCC 30864) TaxID=595528 RepID=A0A0D2WX13_CAPO3|nr:hypothetical protein CAOG_07687 [Capsaspora owczarzaki ATCC 30864]KJE97248.1 hypothetical protein CAOG_007687 [Capsaspora owczarzaki ATCC 30864]|eukprot:XP_004343561.2 hypothetical protein CAOG_07687 [Capsaspora owczarzaki ATCC 30864]
MQFTRSMRKRQRELYDQVKNARKHLAVDRNQISNTEVQIFAEALKVNTTATSLGLAHNQIDDSAAAMIAEALKVNTALAYIDLGWNQIGDAGAQAIAETLKVNKTLTRLGLYQNQISDAGALAIAEALKVNTTLAYVDLRLNCIGNAGLQALGEARQVSHTLLDLNIDQQMHPRMFSLLSRRLATAEDLQNVFHLLSSGLALEDQSAALPALPAEIAELIMDNAHYWQGVQHTKRLHFYDDSPAYILNVTLPQGVNGNSIRVKAINVFRDSRPLYGSNGSSGFDLIVRDEQGAVRYECSVKPTLVDSNLDLVTILPANHPVIRRMRAGWQVQVRASKSSRDVLFESLYVGYF